MHGDMRPQARDGSDGLAPSESWLFAQAIQGKPIPVIINPEKQARAEREKLERLAEISSTHAKELRRLRAAETEVRHERELLEWAAQISPEAETKLRRLVRQEAEDRDAWRRAEQYSEWLREGSWDPSKHPRGAFSQNRGWWSPTSGSGSAVPATRKPNPVRVAAWRGGRAPVRLTATGASAWPAASTTNLPVPNLGSGAIGGARAAAGVAAGGLLAGLNNASMAAYWARVPAAQAMPSFWVYDLDKRVQAGKLSHEDAAGIFYTALLGAQAQQFKPIGATNEALRLSMIGFLGEAEAVYFARKKKAAAERAAGAERAEAAPARVTGGELDNARREFERMKPQLWKEEAEKNPQKYTAEQLASMRKGKAPVGSDGKPMEIHHKKLLSEGGTNTPGNFEFKTYTEHRVGPNFKVNHPNLPRGKRP